MRFDLDLILGWDKQIHFLSYGMLSMIIGIVVVMLSNGDKVSRRMSYVWMALVTFGIAEEYRQLTIETRSAEVLDAVANMLGVTVGLAIPLCVYYVIKFRGHFVVRLFLVYMLFLVPMFIGLLLVNERPFVVIEDGSFREKMQHLMAMIGG
ncbi:VanZ family protein [Gracilibacillus sp. YIM 98692]|uniref:VanZ family protein n=1 Tax=Gracilibacillus sp. YIM 98692 TaxID=2663532 RepID=UPI0013D403D0|nr:VanZ family protein [Gracilibacillus sp. YIM 98692]